MHTACGCMLKKCKLRYCGGGVWGGQSSWKATAAWRDCVASSSCRDCTALCTIVYGWGSTPLSRHSLHVRKYHILDAFSPIYKVQHVKPNSAMRRRLPKSLCRHVARAAAAGFQNAQKYVSTAWPEDTTWVLTLCSVLFCFDGVQLLWAESHTLWKNIILYTPFPTSEKQHIKPNLSQRQWLPIRPEQNHFFTPTPNISKETLTRKKFRQKLSE